MEYTFGFIGTGNMGGALARAIRRGAEAGRMVLHNRTAQKAEALARELSCTAGTLAQAAEQDYVFLGVKPHQAKDVLAQTFPSMQKGAVLVSMAAGLTLEQLAGMTSPDTAIVRILPNTPVSVGKGIVLWSRNACVTDERLGALLSALDPCGVCYPIEERLMEVGSALCGCSPAFTDLYIEALSDGAVACGFPRKEALFLAAKAVEGAAALCVQDGRHPGALKDSVCSPGGSTIQGVRTLEKNGFRSAVIEAIIAADEKGKTLGK